MFNTSTNQLSSLQQQQLAVRAGTLAAGFVAAPLISALERTLGIDTFEIEPISDITGGSGARVTIGTEIAPGLVARFSRNFGVLDYNEASIEYYLSKTISPAGDVHRCSSHCRAEPVPGCRAGWRRPSAFLQFLATILAHEVSRVRASTQRGRCR